MATLYQIRNRRDDFFGVTYDEMVEKIIDFEKEVDDLTDRLRQMIDRVSEIARDFFPDREADASSALDEMREALFAAIAKAESAPC